MCCLVNQTLSHGSSLIASLSVNLLVELAEKADRQTGRQATVTIAQSVGLSFDSMRDMVGERVRGRKRTSDSRFQSL